MTATHTEDERGAATLIQAATRGRQGRLLKARVERGGEGSFAVLDALVSSKRIEATKFDPPSAFTGLGAMYLILTRDASLLDSLRTISSLGRRYAGPASGLFSFLLLLLTVGAAACAYFVPRVLALLFGAIFERTGAGFTSPLQLTGYALGGIGGVVLLLAAASFVSVKLVGEVASGLKARATEVSAAHTKMISQVEHEKLVAGSEQAGKLLFVCLPGVLGALLVIAAAAAHVFTISAAMGLVLGAVLVARTLLAGMHDQISLECFDDMHTIGKEHDDLTEKLQAAAEGSEEHEDLLHEKMDCNLEFKDKFEQAKSACNAARNVAQLIVSPLAVLAIAYLGSLEQRAGAHTSHGTMLAILYAILALVASAALDSALRGACEALRKAAPVASYVSRTASATAAAAAPADASYGAAHVASRARIPVYPKALALLGVVATGAALVAASRSMPAVCAELEVTCVLMDGHEHMLAVPQRWSLVDGCAARQSSAELLDACLAGVPADVVRAQQHKCALDAGAVEARVTWETAQGHRAGHRIREPCTRLDLCAGVACPAIDECHADGVCVAGLCTTPPAADGTACAHGTCQAGVCGATAFVAQPVLAAAAECPGAVEVDDAAAGSLLQLAIPERRDALGELRRELATSARRRALSVAKAPAADEAGACDPRTGVCPGYDQMFCSEPFALNYRETAVYATHCCSELNAMSIFYQTSSVRNKVMVKYHKLQDDFVFQAGGVNYADPLCRTSEETTMLTWQDFDTVAPMFDDGSALAVDTRRYDAFGYPYGEGVLAAEFVLAADDVKGCTVPKAEGGGRRLGYSSAACFLFQGFATYACAGKPSVKGFGNDMNAKKMETSKLYEKDPHTSMLFGKFDFSTFGASAYGSLSTPSSGPSLPMCKPDHPVYGPKGRNYCGTSWKPRGYCGYHSWVQAMCPSTCSDPGVPGAPGPETGLCTPEYGRRLAEAAVAERGYGNGPDFASVTLDFGDFSYMSATVPVKGGRRLADAAATPAPVPASVAAGGFDPLRATALAKLAAAAACAPAGVELKEGALVVRSAVAADALAKDARVALGACAECAVPKSLAAELAAMRANLTAAAAAAGAPVTVVGHGASGALATLAALELSDAGVPVAELVTFGAPRVGNAAFASHFEDSVAFPVHRVTHARDPVPHTPSAAAGFAHVGTEVFFNKASSAYRVCARGEDPSCAASVVVASGVDDHASYMGESFAAKHLECALLPPRRGAGALEAAAAELAA